MFSRGSSTSNPRLSSGGSQEASPGVVRPMKASRNPATLLDETTAGDAPSPLHRFPLRPGCCRKAPAWRNASPHWPAARCPSRTRGCPPPSVIGQRVEQLHHHRAVRREPFLGTLINVADVDQRPVRIFPLPLPDLRGASRQAAEIGTACIIAGRKNVAVQISRVEDRNRDEFLLPARSRGGNPASSAPCPNSPKKRRRE